MGRRLLRRPSPALVVALVALFVAVGGTSYAAVILPKNSVGTAQIKDGAVTKGKIAKRTVAALRGQRGPRGAIGPAGATGPAGPQGAQGPSGNGSNGQFFGDGTNPAVQGLSPGNGAGIYGNSVGVGVYGQGNYIGTRGLGGMYGVVGDAGTGGVGVVADPDLAVAEHIFVSVSGTLAGVCEIQAGHTSVACPLLDFGRNGSPIVVATPTTNPGSQYWITGTTTTEFTLNLAAAPAANVDFNYLVIGIRDCIFPGNTC
jgi:hypothetical protein